MGCTPQSLLSQGRWLGEAETERSSQICSNLSVSLRLTAPLKGEPWIFAPRKKVQIIQIFTVPSIDGNRSKATSIKFDTPVSGGAYQNIRKVTIVWNDACNIGSCLSSDAESTNRNPAPFSPLSFPAQGKRWGRRRRVRNDHDGTNPCKQGFLSFVLVSSFPNRKLNLRFGFFYADLQQPLSQLR